ncbi:MAG: cyclic pyranopterin monophosphate synthase [Actinomycetota bacterium]
MPDRHPDPTAVVLTLSDTVASGAKDDTAGHAVADALDAAGIRVVAREVLPDEPDELIVTMQRWLLQRPEVIVTVGGTGVGPRDHTPDTIRPMLTMEIPGIMEAARVYGMTKTPYAMLSRGIAGLIGTTIVITAPGSRGGATETMEAISEALRHLVDVVHVKFPHDGGYE